MLGILTYRAARMAARNTSKLVKATGSDRPKDTVPWSKISVSAKVVFAALFVLSVVLIGAFVAYANGR